MAKIGTLVKPAIPVLQGGDDLAVGLEVCHMFTERSGTFVRDLVTGVEHFFRREKKKFWAKPNF